MAGLLRSRKFWLAVFGVIQAVVLFYFEVPEEIWQTIAALVAVLIAGIAVEDAGDGGKERRLQQADVLHKFWDFARVVPDGMAPVQCDMFVCALEHMRQGEVADEDVEVRHVGLPAPDPHGAGKDIEMREECALGRSGRAGGVDNRAKIIRLRGVLRTRCAGALCLDLAEKVGVSRPWGNLGSIGLITGVVIHHDDGAECRATGTHFGDKFQVLTCSDDGYTICVVKNIKTVRWTIAIIDRNCNDPMGRAGKSSKHPFDTVLRHDGNTLSRMNSKTGQARCEGSNTFIELPVSKPFIFSTSAIRIKSSDANTFVFRKT